MRRLAAAGLSLAMAVAVSALTIIPTEPVELGRSDRAILEKLACQRPHGVGAQKMSGWRTVMEEKNPVHASVECKPHLITDRYAAFYVTGCDKERATWKCDEPDLQLRLKYLEAGPYDIYIRELEPDAALKALSCLETGLRARPDLVGAEMKVEPWSLIRRNVNGKPSISASMSTPVKRCLSVTFAEACDAGGLVPLDVESAECLEDF